MEVNLRHYCRNQRCRSKLKAPVDNVHHAFCCSGCYKSFYRTRCVVCEDKIRRKGDHQKFGSGHAKCRSEYRRFPHVYDYPKTAGTAHTSSFARQGGGSAHLTGLQSALEGVSKNERPRHRSLRGWSWVESDLELGLRDGTGAVLARLERNRGRYRLTRPLSFPILSWGDEAEARHEAETLALGSLGLADIRAEKRAPHPLGAPKGSFAFDGMPAGRIAGGKGVDFDLPAFLSRRRP